MTSHEIRQDFLNFFVQRHGHTFVPSSPVVPHEDPTLLFTNAGMNQFKPYFLGVASAPISRAVNSQKCIRAGGKHNDLDDVGRSRRHHTFFEMLGNWSFGDYFKAGAIEMAWELLTKRWKLDPQRLHVTVYGGNPADGVPADDEAADLWRKIAGLPDDHIHRFVDENFWEMGETGPCGPCTEIFIDRTEKGDGGPAVNGSDPRVMEIWNLVFIQYNRGPGRRLTPLPAQHVDTGMGLERICQVLQGKEDNYSTDLFTPLFKAISELSGTHYGGAFPESDQGGRSEDDTAGLSRDIAYRVIADHVRCLTFALTDGAIPSNEGRGYVLRRILRRAVRFGRQYLGLREAFLHQLSGVVVTSMADAFPELSARPGQVAAIIRDEEEGFSRTLDRGLELFAAAAADAAGATGDRRTISAEAAFKLHDTYGFPIDLTEVIAREQHLAVDVVGYNRLMDEAREKARRGGKVSQQQIGEIPPDVLKSLEVLNIHRTDDQHKYIEKPIRAAIRAIWDGKTLLDKAVYGETGDLAIITDKTNFYPQMGGQIGDSGSIECDAANRFVVRETQIISGWVLHIGTITHGKICVGNAATLEVDNRRKAIEHNHTATHLTNWALRAVLGEHVEQKGSLVDHEKFRFDFSQPQPVSAEELERIENLVRQQITRDLPVHTLVVDLEKARNIHGLRAVFGEKYPPQVRVVSIGAPVENLVDNPSDAQWLQFSIEFCGGTHVARTSALNDAVIFAEESVSKGIRRLAGVTGALAKQARQQGDVIESLMQQSNQEAIKNPEALQAALQTALKEPLVPLVIRRKANEALSRLGDLKKQKSRQIAAHHAAMTQEQIDGILQKAIVIGDATLIVSHLGDGDGQMLRDAGETLRKAATTPAVAILLAAQSHDLDKDGNPLPPKINFIAMVSENLTGRLPAGDWVKQVAKLADGAGGGRPQMAMAGGKNVAAADIALSHGREIAQRSIG